MADKISQFVAWSDNANEYADMKREKLKQRALEDIDEIFSDVGARDGDLWESFDIDAELTVDDYDSVEPGQRDINWVAGFGAMAAAAGIQFFLDNRDDLLISPAAYRAQVLKDFELTRAELIRAGKREVIRFEIDGFQKLQYEFVEQFALLRDMSNTTLYAELQNMKALQSFDKYASDSIGYVSRMTNYPTGSPQFKEAVADLVNMHSTSAQQRINRRSIEALSVERQTKGDGSLQMVWVLDPTSKHCAYCPSRAGEIMSYNEWVAYGLPGADVCRGGDRCNCHLVII